MRERHNQGIKQGRRPISEVKVHQVERAKGRSVITQHDGKVYINLEDINVPVEIRAKSFEDACSILKENLDSTDLSIYIQNSSIPEEEEESREEKKNIFLKELRELKNLQNLSLEIE